VGVPESEKGLCLLVGLYSWTVSAMLIEVTGRRSYYVALYSFDMRTGCDDERAPNGWLKSMAVERIRTGGRLWYSTDQQSPVACLALQKADAGERCHPLRVYYGQISFIEISSRILGGALNLLTWRQRGLCLYVRHDRLAFVKTISRMTE